MSYSTRTHAWAWSRRNDHELVAAGVSCGRRSLSWERTRPKRWAARSGGGRTPGPWRQVAVPRIGSFTLGYDATLFGPVEHVDTDS